jgi:hypothetical protein
MLRRIIFVTNREQKVDIVPLILELTRLENGRLIALTVPDRQGGDARQGGAASVSKTSAPGQARNAAPAGSASSAGSAGSAGSAADISDATVGEKEAKFSLPEHGLPSALRTSHMKGESECR